uniref:Uncharacterized protein n=1 Tax=Stomoxys calcitrans TaxID=35570 RepID=A0A1I8PW96_STOCA
MALFPSSSRPRSLMEQLLARKIEAAAQSVTGPGGTRLRRTDSLDSTSSIGSLGSLVLGDDVCRCDDCLLGIVDLYVISAEAAKKKATHTESLIQSSAEPRKHSRSAANIQLYFHSERVRAYVRWRCVKTSNKPNNQQQKQDHNECATNILLPPFYLQMKFSIVVLI